MPSKNLVFELLGRDKSASKAIQGVGRTANSIQSSFHKLGGIIGGVFATRQIIAWGEAAVDAYIDAEKAQTKLTDAIARFPAVQGANVKALQEYNKELMRTSRFDDDVIAGAEAQLLQYGLTEKQLKELIPLTLDYAARTGKDLTSASEDLGKAMLGQGRALKNVGIDFKDTGTLAGNFDQLIAGLRAQVEGFSEKDLTTAEGKLENLRNRFGEIQEQVGGPLIDALMALADEFEEDLLNAAQGFADWLKGDGLEAIKGFIGFISDNKDSIPLAIGLTTAAIWGLNAAMLANPAGLVIAGLAAVLALMWHFTVVDKEVGGSIRNFQMGLFGLANDIALSIATVAEGFVNTVIDGLNMLIGPINTVRNALGLGSIALGHANFTSGFLQNRNMLGIAQQQSNHWASGGVGKPPSVQGNAYDYARSFGLAEGGVVRHRPGGIFANIGEGRWDEAVVPLSPSNMRAMGGGGDNYYISVPGGYVGDENRLVQKLATAVSNVQRRGAVPRGAFN